MIKKKKIGILIHIWYSVRICPPGVGGLKLLQVSMPSLRTVGQSAQLTCRYDLEGEPLYSVKW